MNIIQLFAALGGAPPHVQYLRPNRDWSSPNPKFQAAGETELWECIDDVIPDEDATYVYSDENGGYWYPGLTTPRGTPRSDQLHRVLWRMRYTGTSQVTPYINWTLHATLQSNRIHTADYVPFTTEWADYSYDLTPEEIAKINGDYSNLFFAVWFGNLPDPASEVRNTQMYLQIGGE